MESILEKTFSIDQIFPFKRAFTEDLDENGLGAIFKKNKVLHLIFERTSAHPKLTDPSSPFLCAPLFIKESTLNFSKLIPNLDPVITKRISKYIGLGFIPEEEEGNVCFAYNNEELRDDFKQVFTAVDLLDYIYFHSFKFRIKREMGLVHPEDSSLLPYPTNSEEFWREVKLGKKLRQLHLLAYHGIQDGTTGFPIKGTHPSIFPPEVKKVWFQVVESEEGKIWINKKQYFDKIPREVWRYKVRNRNPLLYWLTERKRVLLTEREIKHFQKMVATIFETLLLLNNEVKD